LKDDIISYNCIVLNFIMVKKALLGRPIKLIRLYCFGLDVAKYSNVIWSYSFLYLY